MELAQVSLSGDWLLLYIHFLSFVIDIIWGSVLTCKTQTFNWSERNVSSLNQRI